MWTMPKSTGAGKAPHRRCLKILTARGVSSLTQPPPAIDSHILRCWPATVAAASPIGERIPWQTGGSSTKRQPGSKLSPPIPACHSQRSARDMRLPGRTAPSPRALASSCKPSKVTVPRPRPRSAGSCHQEYRRCVVRSGHAARDAPPGQSIVVGPSYRLRTA